MSDRPGVNIADSVVTGTVDLSTTNVHTSTTNVHTNALTCNNCGSSGNIMVHNCQNINCSKDFCNHCGGNNSPGYAPFCANCSWQKEKTITAVVKRKNIIMNIANYSFPCLFVVTFLSILIILTNAVAADFFVGVCGFSLISTLLFWSTLYWYIRNKALANIQHADNLWWQ